MKKFLLISLFLLAASCQRVAQAPINPQPIACTMEAKLCPDGTAVGRTGPNCEFSACPNATSTPPTTTPPSPSQNPNSGIKGTVLLGPTCPVMRDPPDPQCADKPYQATIIVKSAATQKTITQFTSQTDGTFSINLPPGTYLLTPSSTSMYPRGTAQTVVVEKDKYSQITINYDTGIR